MKIVSVIIVLAWITGCATPNDNIQRAAAVAIDCPKDQIKISNENNGLLKVSGCDQLTYLDCDEGMSHTSCSTFPVETISDNSGNLSH